MYPPFLIVRHKSLKVIPVGALNAMDWRLYFKSLPIKYKYFTAV
ncbi:hypothetical protein C7972_109202 [Arenibacter sp. ARW7G5Y1]|nr:hypothetical protein C7972_109202 [Arenibacter sp. ARW7G5Y1]